MRVESHGFQRVAVATATVVALTLTFMASSTYGAMLVDFLPQPASDDMPEFKWDGTTLTSGPGAFGTNFGVPGPGDGDELPEDQDVPGLQIVTPFVIGGQPGGVVNTDAGSTTFYDVTLDITTSHLATNEYGFYVVEELTGGQFEIWSTDPADDPGADVENPILLLAGLIDTAMIAGILHSDAGAVLSAEITYTDGRIYQAAQAMFGIQEITGSFSWSLLDINSPLSVTNGLLDSFEANGTGQFSGVPEPATMVLLVSGACMLAIRRRRRA